MKIYQEGLTKENFFDEAFKLYPKAMAIFCRFVDDYKEAVGWSKLFGDKIEFHDLPYDMQSGIWYRLLVTLEEIEDIDLRSGIKNWLSDNDFRELFG